MRRLDGLIPGAAEHDEFGKHCVKLLKRALELNSMDAALKEEILNPTWDDPDWCRMIVARTHGLEPIFQHDDTVLLRCSKCGDTGYIVRDEVQRNGQMVRLSRRCDPCAFMRWLATQYEARQEREGAAKRRSRLGDA